MERRPAPARDERTGREECEQGQVPPRDRDATK